MSRGADARLAAAGIAMTVRRPVPSDATHPSVFKIPSAARNVLRLIPRSALNRYSPGN